MVTFLPFQFNFEFIFPLVSILNTQPLSNSSSLIILPKNLKLPHICFYSHKFSQTSFIISPVSPDLRKSNTQWNHKFLENDSRCLQERMWLQSLSIQTLNVQMLKPSSTVTLISASLITFLWRVFIKRGDLYTI